MTPDYSYQIPLIKGTFENLIKHKIALLAACPGAGKTNMAIEIIKNYLAKYPGNSVLILTHNQKVLQHQFEDRLKSLGVENRNIHVTIPSALFYMKGIRTFDLLICDEAHHYYLAAMVQDIISKHKVKHQLLLTGTPRRFLSKKIPISFITLGTLIEKGILENITIKLQNIGLEFDFESYNRDSFELKASALKKVDLKKILSPILKEKEKEKEKVMIICANQDQALKIFDWMPKNKTSISITELTNIKEISHFKENGHNFLILVNRGILGFDFKDLTTVIDISFSLNADRNFQSLCRLVRKGTQKKSKIYYKFSAMNLMEETSFVMNSVVDMAHEDGYLSIEPEAKIKKRDLEDLRTRKKFAQFEDLDFSVKDTTEYESLSFLNFRSGKTNYTKEQALEYAKKCKSLKEFRFRFKTPYMFLIKNGYLKELHNVLPSSVKIGESFTVESARAFCKQFASNTELRSTSRGNKCYRFLLKNDAKFLKENFRKFTDLCEKELIRLLKEKGFKTRKEVALEASGIVRALEVKGIKEKVFDLLYPLNRASDMTKQELMAYAKKHWDSKREMDDDTNRGKYMAALLRKKHPGAIDKIWQNSMR